MSDSEEDRSRSQEENTGERSTAESPERSVSERTEWQ